MPHLADRVAGTQTFHASGGAADCLFLSRNSAMRRIYERVRRIASMDLVVLLTGESGVGKTRLAHQIHRWSRRSEQPFLCVNLGAMDDPLSGSDLFGHVKGAYTGADSKRAGALGATHNGTLFCDELGKATPAVQRKLLAVLDRLPVLPIGSDRPVTPDVRLVLAANEPLIDLVTGGRMLEELYARAACWTFEIPPLRERREDIPALIRHYVAEGAETCGYGIGPLPSVHRDLEAFLVGCSWPYNLRQLHDVVQRIMFEAEGAAELTLSHIPNDIRRMLSASPFAAVHEASNTDRDARFAEALRLTGGNKAAAARRLDVSESTVWRWLRDHPETRNGGQSPE